jgi:large subunit ribosomal protein L28
MSRKCELTGVGPTTGNLVSHSNIKTKTRWLPNLQDRKYFLPELGQVLSIRLSTRAIRTIDKQGGISSAVRKAKFEHLSPKLQGIARKLTRMVSKGSLHPAERVLRGKEQSKQGA